MRRLLATLGLSGCLAAFAAEIIPPAPKQYFNDYAGVVSAPTVERLNRTLEEFEKATSSQILVVVYPKMQSDSSLEDYTVRVAQSWKVGQKKQDNGAVLFVFAQDHKLFLQVGYGLEGALPDARCKQIIDREITPRFKAGDFDGGLTAGVNAIIAATKGEYKGTGQTVGSDSDARPSHARPLPLPVIVRLIVFGFILLIYILARVFGRREGTVYQRGGYSGYSGWGGGGGGGGGGFSGGGGGFGGGGAGGSW